MDNAKRKRPDHDYDSEEERRKGKQNEKRAKQAPGRQTFISTYSEKFPGITKSRKGDGFAHCSFCVCDIRIGHGGASDIKRHTATEKHLSFKESVKMGKSQSVLNMFKAKEKDSLLTGSGERATTKAEVILCEVVAQQNLVIIRAIFSSIFICKLK